MCNATIKIVTSLLMTAVFVSCDRDKDAAQSLLSQARQSIEDRNYHQAVLLLDSIDSAYASQVGVRRLAMNVRPRAVEGMTLNEIEKIDSVLAVSQAEYSTLTPYFETVNDPRLVEPYIVAKNAPKSLLETTGIQARITSEGDFYVISSLVGGGVKHTSVSFIANGQTVSSLAVAYDGDRNYRSNGSEMITFVKDECDTLGVFASQNDNQTIILRFNGDRLSKSIKMSSEDVHSFALTHRYARLVSDIKSSMRRKEFLEQQLSLARDQIARTLDESAINGK